MSKEENKEPCKTEVDPFWELSDIKNMLDFFEMETERYPSDLLVFILGLALGRRVFDTIAFKTSDFFDDNGNIKLYIDIKERKTGKSARLSIGKWAKDSIMKYVESIGLDVKKEKYLFPHEKKYTYENNTDNPFYNNSLYNVYECQFETFEEIYKIWCDVVKKNYTEKQSNDTYKLFINRNKRSSKEEKRKTLSEFLRDQEFYEAVNTQIFTYRLHFKKAADFCDIKYPVSTHSTRKTFGYWSRKLHPYDIDSIEILQDWYGHTDTKTTMHYIGLNNQRISQYVNDMDGMLHSVSEGKEFEIKNSPIISNKTEDLMDLFLLAYEYGKDGKDSTSMLKDIFVMAQEIAVQ